MAGQDHLPIGVFDSGIGGLTVLRVIHRTLPEEATLYLGDTARVPYGTKSPEVVTRYALNNARFRSSSIRVPRIGSPKRDGTISSASTLQSASIPKG